MTPTASAAIHLSRPPNVVHKPIFNVESNGAVGGSRYIECGAEIHYFVSNVDYQLFIHHRGAPIVDVIHCPINPSSNIIWRFELCGGSGENGPLQRRLERGIKCCHILCLIEGQWWSINPCHHRFQQVMSSHNLHTTIPGGFCWLSVWRHPYHCHYLAPEHNHSSSHHVVTSDVVLVK